MSAVLVLASAEEDAEAVREWPSSPVMGEVVLRVLRKLVSENDLPEFVYHYERGFAALEAIARARLVTIDLGPEPNGFVNWELVVEDSRSRSPRYGKLLLKTAQGDLVADFGWAYTEHFARPLAHRFNALPAALARIAELEDVLSRVAVVALNEGATGVQDIIGDECSELYARATT